MTKTIASGDLGQSFESLIDSLNEPNDEVIVERDGRPVAVLMSIATYDRLLREEAERDWAIIDRLRQRNAERDPDEVFADVTAEIEALRKERRQAGLRSA
jgi:prevent-host-death family protein